MGQAIEKMIEVMNQLEADILDLQGRSWRENLRVYNIHEGESSMVQFMVHGSWSSNT